MISRSRCPYCSEEISATDMVCKYCGKNISGDSGSNRIFQNNSRYYKKRESLWGIGKNATMLIIIVSIITASFYEYHQLNNIYSNVLWFDILLTIAVNYAIIWVVVGVNRWWFRKAGWKGIVIIYLFILGIIVLMFFTNILKNPFQNIISPKITITHTPNSTPLLISVNN